MYRTPDGAPMTRYGVAGSRLDVTTVAGGLPVEFIEMKFPGDRLRGTQGLRYQQIARMNGYQLQMMNIPQDCNNCLAPAPAPATTTETKESKSSISDWLMFGGGVIAVGAAVYFSGGLAAAFLAAGGGTVIATQ